jgi:hypothetical protein
MTLARTELTALALLITACNQRAPGGDPGSRDQGAAHQESTVEPIQLDALFTSTGDATFIARLGEAEAVFVGVLEDVGPAPTTFSGYQAAMQSLSYKVERVLRGTVDQPVMTVHQVIVAGSPTLDGGKPALRPDVTQIGQRYVVAVGGTLEGKRITANENLPPILATPDVINRVQAALR